MTVGPIHRHLHRLGDGTSARPTADEIDRRLHAERTASDRSRHPFVASMGELPAGEIVAVTTWGERAYLMRGDRLLAWSPEGYSDRRRRPKDKAVRVLTPPSTVQAIRAGYVPDIHPSAVGIG